LTKKKPSLAKGGKEEGLKGMKGMKSDGRMRSVRGGGE